ncbi:facilitated trehalose transporter Tret1-like isoform X2 [Agrilus planipennis]|uniref:Facilitated trehalose transporter Tret1-like isoform X2 n=1 Tax=Agrilus planipennis TaxID=224129 RepID=A0A7F5RKR4_AGRPL|nr:facilitated trehalose transporter Tret1-like isoform X2 [Agrilus planipennis]
MKWRLILLQLLSITASRNHGTIGTISDGMQYGWTAPNIPKLHLDDSPIKIEKHDEEWIENIYMIGNIAGLLFTIIYMKFLGRKIIVILAAIKHVIAWILIATATRIEVLYCARFLAGAAGNIAFVSLPMYIAEVADESIRGFLGTFVYTSMILGVLVIYSVAPFTSIAVSSSVGAACVTLQIITFSFMPESPYYHIIKGNQEAALKSLQTFRRREDVYDELKDITSAVERQESEKGRIIDIFIVRSNLKAFIIAITLNFAQHFSGISVLLMNVHTILADAESVISAETGPIIIAATMLIACIASSFIIDKFGRKKLLVSSSILTGLALTVLATYFYIKNSDYDISNLSWIPVVSVTMYSLFFKFGLGMVPIVFLGELFPTSVKGMAMSIVDISYGMCAILSVYVYIHLSSLYGIHVPFFIFAGLCIFAALFSQFCIPETKGKTLEEIQMILKGM